MKIVLNGGNIPSDSSFPQSTRETEKVSSLSYKQNPVEGENPVTVLPPLMFVKGPKSQMDAAGISTPPPKSSSSRRQSGRRRQQKESSKDGSSNEVRIGGHLTGQSRRSPAYLDALKTRPNYTHHAPMGSEEFRKEAKLHVFNQDERGVCTKENCRAFQGSTKIEFDDSTDCMFPFTPCC